ncbi:hypothetical protein JOD82_002105 [Paenibacillus sp. 1182]|uniref:hypothetical protein n=1 Tax=Paenibacillus sp. 1182 TaxID=2806565 RepID=UPI001AEAEC7F|nr:hypothetical protein [Paenibacillus sp. 1182]MBP1309085.1 hypothetical protein [Paenibacillus sp. 1182]
MAKIQKQANHFEARYKKYIRNSIADNSRIHINRSNEDRKNENDDIKKHLIDYENSNQTIIGSLLFTLLYQSRFEKDKYMQTRLHTLKTIYQFVVDNHAWYDLWKAFVTIENKLNAKGVVINHQLSTEIFDLLRMNLPLFKWVIGLHNDNTPIIKRTPFFVTEQVLNMFERGERGIGRKKVRDLRTIQYQTIELQDYLLYSFGLYSDDNLDLLPVRGMNYDALNNEMIHLPRIIGEWSDLAGFIEDNRHYTLNPNGVVVDCYNCGDIDQILFIGIKRYKYCFRSDSLVRELHYFF